MTDTGIGIPLDAQGTLFDAFTQADNSATRQYGGSGLGLAIAEQLVEMFEGTIGVESTPGQGSTFWFVVKLERSAAPDGYEALDRSHFQGHRVLWVTGHATQRAILEQQLHFWGYPLVDIDPSALASTGDLAALPVPGDCLLAAFLPRPQASP